MHCCYDDGRRMEKVRLSSASADATSMEIRELCLLLSSSSNFCLEKAVCNHGFFMMAPNIWSPSNKSLQRPLRLANSTTSVMVSISQRTTSSLLIKIDQHHAKSLSFIDHQAILHQVARMLRISEKDERDVQEFQHMHLEAKERGFGRLFRSPSLFEDIVKSILLCNCTWERSLSMAQSLCNLQLELTHLSYDGEETQKGVKRTRQVANGPSDVKHKTVPITANFPNSKELASLEEDFLSSRCSLGYRAKTILEIAKRVEIGKLKLNEFGQECSVASYKELCKHLRKIKGIGPFTVANVSMCIGVYQEVPADKETLRQIKEVHGRTSCSQGTMKKHVKEIYDKYAPFQCLAYWMELLCYYENKFGKLSELPPSSYNTVSGGKKTQAI